MARIYLKVCSVLYYPLSRENRRLLQPPPTHTSPPPPDHTNTHTQFFCKILLIFIIVRSYCKAPSVPVGYIYTVCAHGHSHTLRNNAQTPPTHLPTYIHSYTHAHNSNLAGIEISIYLSSLSVTCLCLCVSTIFKSLTVLL